MDDINYLSDKHMGQICKRLTNLKQISMWSSARHLSAFAFKQISFLTKLTTLKLDSNKLITDEVRNVFHHRNSDSHSSSSLSAHSSDLSIMHGTVLLISDRLSVGYWYLHESSWRLETITSLESGRLSAGQRFGRQVSHRWRMYGASSGIEFNQLYAHQW